MEKDSFDKVQYMINKEMTRCDLSDLCEDWGVEVDEYAEFMALARYGFNVANVKTEVEL